MSNTWRLVTAWLRQHSLLSGLLLIACFVLLSYGSTLGVHFGPLRTTRNSITYDEVSHIGSSYFYDHEHTYYLNPEHPPLVKVVAGLPLQFMHLRPGKLDPDPRIYFREDNQWNYGNSFLFVENVSQTDRIVTVARLAVTLFNAALLVAIFWILTRLVSKRAGLIALSLLIFNPVILGHASLVTFDVPAALTIVLCLLTYVYYLKAPGWRRALLVGIALAIALLSKFSTVFLIPIIVIGGAAWLLITRRPLKDWGRWLLHGGLIALVALFLICSFMVPLTIHSSSAALQQQFSHNWPGHLRGPEKHVLDSMLKMGAYPKALAAWLNGFFIIQNVVEGGKVGTVFLGTFHGLEGPGPLYYPVLFVTKQPLAAVFLLLTMPLYLLTYAWRQLRRLKSRLRPSAAVIYTLLGLFALAYLAFVTKQPFKIGIRHFLPFVLSVLVLAAVIIDRHWRARLVGKLRVAHVYLLLLPLIVLSTLITFPSYLSYYNLLGGGVKNGYKIAVDSNYDWGQDMIRLRDWKNEHGVTELYTDLFANPFGVQQHYLGTVKPINSLGDYHKVPSGAYVAVSANQLEGHEAVSKQRYVDVYGQQPLRLSPTIFIFRKP